MKEYTVYLCEKCGETYKDRESAMECEKSHISPKCIDMRRFHYNSIKNEGKYGVSEYDIRYPRNIRVIMEDGIVVTYFLDRNSKFEKHKKDCDSNQADQKT